MKFQLKECFCNVEHADISYNSDSENSLQFVHMWQFWYC